eukprot:TRINITY_DN42275_c0_g1_i1.p1 TRINITY_DN42275_c0_g1~~TRINITY_DN42275_c0_g1_i1.p1  ORF type:complete len:452 (+),score=39.52 TRINITY_DN42275_c0_g1_i1:88-1443(+)
MEREVVASGEIFGGRLRVSSNTFACGSNQNCGNVLSDIPTTRVARPPGGSSSLSLSWDTGDAGDYAQTKSGQDDRRYQSSGRPGGSRRSWQPENSDNNSKGRMEASQPPRQQDDRGYQQMPAAGNSRQSRQPEEYRYQSERGSGVSGHSRIPEEYGYEEEDCGRQTKERQYDPRSSRQREDFDDQSMKGPGKSRPQTQSDDYGYQQEDYSFQSAGRSGRMSGQQGDNDYQSEDCTRQPAGRLGMSQPSRHTEDSDNHPGRGSGASCPRRQPEDSDYQSTGRSGDPRRAWQQEEVVDRNSQFGGRPRQSSNSFASGSNQNSGNFITSVPTTRVNKPPGGSSQFSLSWDSQADGQGARSGGPRGKGGATAAHASEMPLSGRGATQGSTAGRFGGSAASSAYANEGAFGVRPRESSNTFARGSDQNCGNMISDTPTTRVLRPPGGDSSFSLGWN